MPLERDLGSVDAFAVQRGVDEAWSSTKQLPEQGGQTPGASAVQTWQPDLYQPAEHAKGTVGLPRQRGTL